MSSKHYSSLNNRARKAGLVFLSFSTLFTFIVIILCVLIRTIIMVITLPWLHSRMIPYKCPLIKYLLESLKEHENDHNVCTYLVTFYLLFFLKKGILCYHKQREEKDFHLSNKAINTSVQNSLF